MKLKSENLVAVIEREETEQQTEDEAHRIMVCIRAPFSEWKNQGSC